MDFKPENYTDSKFFERLLERVNRVLSDAGFEQQSLSRSELAQILGDDKIPTMAMQIAFADVLHVTPGNMRYFMRQEPTGEALLDKQLNADVLISCENPFFELLNGYVEKYVKQSTNEGAIAGVMATKANRLQALQQLVGKGNEQLVDDDSEGHGGVHYFSVPRLCEYLNCTALPNEKIVTLLAKFLPVEGKTRSEKDLVCKKFGEAAEEYIQLDLKRKAMIEDGFLGKDQVLTDALLANHTEQEGAKYIAKYRDISGYKSGHKSNKLPKPKARTRTFDPVPELEEKRTYYGGDFEAASMRLDEQDRLTAERKAARDLADIEELKKRGEFAKREFKKIIRTVDLSSDALDAQSVVAPKDPVVLMEAVSGIDSNSEAKAGEDASHSSNVAKKVVVPRKKDVPSKPALIKPEEKVSDVTPLREAFEALGQSSGNSENKTTEDKSATLSAAFEALREGKKTRGRG